MTSSILTLDATAIHFLECGIPLVLLQPGLKAPISGPDGSWVVLTDPDQVPVLDQHPDCNLGVVLAPKHDSPLVVIDVDGAAALDHLRSLGLTSGASVWVSHTGRGGFHVYYYWQGAKAPPRRAVRVGKLPVDLLSNGFAVCPPSNTSKEQGGGGPYRWAPGKGPLDTPLSELDPLPEALLAWWQRQAASSSSSNGSVEDAPEASAGKAWTLLKGPIPDGYRHDTLVRVAGWIRLHHPELVGLALLEAINDARCIPPLSKGEVQQIAESVWRYPQPEKRGPVLVRFVEEGQNGR